MTQEASNRRSRALIGGASILAVLLPMCQLLRPGLSPRVNDWENSLWAAGYTGEYLLTRRALPGVLNTDKFVGHPVPVFYAPLLYPCLGAAGNVLGIGASVRLAAILAWTLQFLLACRLFHRVTACRFRALAGGALICWAIYPLTNLYNRGALAEFFGTTLLLCAACAGGLALLEPKQRTRIACASLCGLCGAAAAGSHAITAVVGGTSLLCLTPSALRLGTASPGKGLRLRYAVTALLGVAALVVVSPWLYATLQFSGRLRITDAAQSLGYIPEYDRWYVRLSPVPLPTPASGNLSVGIPATPYLDPQLNCAMLALVLWTLFTLWRSRRAEAGQPPQPSTIEKRKPQSGNRPGDTSASLLLRASLVLFLAAFALSVVPEIGWHMPRSVGGLIQFAYRLVTYQNLAIVVALVASLVIRGSASLLPNRLGRADALAWVAALALSGVGLTVKLVHVARSLAPNRAETAWAADPSRLMQMPQTYYGERDYAVVDEKRMLYNELPALRHDAITLALPPGNRFGEAGVLLLDEPAARWVATDVIAFPWNRLVLDGQLLLPGLTRNAPNQLAAHVPAGRHTLGYAFDPPAAWAVLRTVSLAVAFVWVMTVMVLFARAAQV